MNDGAWSPSWLEGDGVASQRMQVWRGVEAQHVVSTMRLVDTLAEQDMLETLLESSKPPPPMMKDTKHYLLLTPFRYRPHHSSRFRRAGALGVWYGAEEISTACAEVAHWRHRFIMDSGGLTGTELLTEHTFFQATVDGVAIDLMNPPWKAARPLWTHETDYTETKLLAEAAMDRGVQWICYESARATDKRCAAVLDVEALAMVDETTSQTWHCKATRKSVMLIHGADRYVYDFK